MRRKLWLLLLLVLPVLSSCQIVGPDYAVTGVVTDGPRVQLVGERFWETTFITRQDRRRTEYYLIPIGGEGELGKPQLFFKSGKDETAEFTSIDEGTYLARVDSTSGNSKIFVIRTAGQFPEAKYITSIDRRNKAFAITRSGRYLLTVTDARLRILDLVENKVVEETAGHPLVQAFLALRERTGMAEMPGEWFISNDLRYILVFATYEMRTYLDRSETIIPEGVDSEVDFRKYAAIYDRHEKRMHRLGPVLPYETDKHAGKGRIADVESVNGELLLLYRDSSTVVIVGGDGTVACEQVLPGASRWSSKLRWNADDGSLRILDAPWLRGPGEVRLYEVDCRTGRRSMAVTSVGAVARAIETGSYSASNGR